MIPAMNSCKKEKYIGIRLSEKEYQMVKSEAEHDPDCRSKSGTINISKFIRNRVLMPERNAIRVERKMEDLIFKFENRNQYSSGHEKNWILSLENFLNPSAQGRAEKD